MLSSKEVIINLYLKRIPNSGYDAINYFIRVVPKDIRLQGVLSQLETFTFDGQNGFFEWSYLKDFFANVAKYCTQLKELCLKDFFSMGSPFSDRQIKERMAKEIKFSTSLIHVSLNNVSSLDSFVSGLMELFPSATLKTLSIVKISPSEIVVREFLQRLFENNTELQALEISLSQPLSNELMTTLTDYLKINPHLEKLVLEDNEFALVSDSVIKKYVGTLKSHPKINY